jgi:hypothetical protein
MHVSICREGLQSTEINAENVPGVIEALQSVKRDQQQLIDILNDEERQIEAELKECEYTIGDDPSNDCFD